MFVLSSRNVLATSEMDMVAAGDGLRAVLNDLVDSKLSALRSLQHERLRSAGAT